MGRARKGLEGEPPRKGNAAEWRLVKSGPALVQVGVELERREAWRVEEMEGGMEE